MTTDAQHDGNKPWFTPGSQGAFRNASRRLADIKIRLEARKKSESKQPEGIRRANMAFSSREIQDYLDGRGAGILTDSQLKQISNDIEKAGNHAHLLQVLGRIESWADTNRAMGVVSAPEPGQP